MSAVTADISCLHFKNSSVVMEKEGSFYTIRKGASLVKTHDLAVHTAHRAGAPEASSRLCKSALNVFADIDHLRNVYGLIFIGASYPEVGFVHISLAHVNGEGEFTKNRCAKDLTAVAVLLFIDAVFDMIGNDLAVFKFDEGSISVSTSLEADDADFFIIFIFFNIGNSSFNGIVCENIIAVENKYPIGFYMGVRIVESRVLSAVFLIMILDHKLGILAVFLKNLC